MAVELKVPSVGESVTEVQIGEWLKAEGDTAARDEALVMIETDKVTVELPAPVAGKISKIVHQAGDTVAIGDIVGYMEEGDGAQESSAQPQKQESQAGAAAEPSESAAKQPTQREPAAQSQAQATSSQSREAEVAQTRSTQSSEASGHIMPAAARALHEAGLSADQVQGSGPGGRVLKEDVERAAAAGAGPQEDKALARGAYREEEVVPMTTMRRRIAERLVEAQQVAAMLTTFNEIDMGAVMALRKEYQEPFLDKYEIKLGFMSFFVKACVDALKQFPAINAEIREKNIVYKNYYDIGVAVGGGKGLVVPVIRNAERLSFAEVEKTIKDLGTRAKKNTLTLDDLTGGTFTITNGGVYGSLLSTPILNPPQSGILGLHGIQERPVAHDGAVVIRPMMYVALTYDHRVVDGREAVTFLRRIKETVEDPMRMLIEV